MEIIYKVKKILKKKDESIIFDLYLKDYDKSNFYFALVFNKKIEKFKVLYFPIDAVGDNDSIEEYFCYQFIFLHTVNYLMDAIDSNEDIYKNENLDRANYSINAYYIEINTFVGSKEYKFTFTQFIDKKFAFFFDVIVTLFEHLPNIVSELCGKLLAEFNDNSEIVRYKESYDFDLKNDSLATLFEDDIVKKTKYTYDDIDFIECIGNRWYAIVDDNLIIIDYFEFNNLLNVSIPDNVDPHGDEVYIVLKAIKNNCVKEFYRLMVVDNKLEFINGDDAKYYLCYGIDGDKFKLVNSKENIELGLLEKECVKIRNVDSLLEEQLRKILSIKYENVRIDELLRFSLVTEP